MKTVTFITPEGKTRYYLADDSVIPISVALDYLRFRDNQGKARNTLRSNCYQLQNYFIYLQETGKECEDATVDDVAEFMAWMRNPELH